MTAARPRYLVVHLAPLTHLLRDVDLLRSLAEKGEVHLICRNDGHPLLVGSGQGYIRSVHCLRHPDRRWQGLRAWSTGHTWHQLGRQLQSYGFYQVLWVGAKRRHVGSWIRRWLPHAQVDQVPSGQDWPGANGLDISESMRSRARDWLKPARGRIVGLMSHGTPQDEWTSTARRLLDRCHAQHLLVFEPTRAQQRGLAQLATAYQASLRPAPGLDLLPAICSELTALISDQELPLAVAQAVGTPTAAIASGKWHADDLDLPEDATA
ncbi:MAG: hypothetical protein ACOCXA_03850 [Planctomycetota bacterium]